MKITYDSWQQIDFNSFRVGLDESLVEESGQTLEILNNGSMAYSATTISNSYIAGFFGGYEYQIKGSNFSNSNATITSLLFRSDTDYFKASGRLTENSVGETVGYLSAIEYSNFNLNNSFKFVGKANELSYTGTTTFILAGNKYTFSGSFNTDVNGNIGIDAITTGIVSGFSFEDTQGHKISVENVAIDYATFKSLTSNSSNISNLYAALSFDGNDTVTGTSGDDVLDGGAGADVLIGGLGNDTYDVDLLSNGALQDKVTEAKNAGLDTLQLRGDLALASAVTIKLPKNVENLDISLTNNSLLNLTGDTAANTLTGNAANNVIDGGKGADTMIGGAGDDTYVLDNIGDFVIEVSASGIDQVNIKFTAGGYTLGDNIENGFIAHSKAFSLNGNALDNSLIGGSGKNILNGGAGDDTLTGGKGADTFRFMLADKGSSGDPSIDTIADFNIKEKDVLDFRDFQFGVSEQDITSLLNYLDISTNGNNTELHLSAAGGFSQGIYVENAEDTRIVLANVNLLAGTDEATLLQTLMSKNQLLID